MPRYIVIENTPGYLPEEDDPYVTDDLESAKAYMTERVGSYCEYLCEGYDWRDDYSPDVTKGDDGMYAYVYDPERTHDLGRYFGVEPYEDETPNDYRTTGTLRDWS